MAVNVSSSTAGASGSVAVTLQDGVARVTLSNPQRLNAITVAMWHQLRDVFNDLSADSRLRCVVIRGNGGNFAAGADISEFPRHRFDKRSVINYHRQVLAPALRAVATCMHPVIAAIQGVCVGGGLEIASQCDFRIAADSARFGVPINKLGFPMAPDEMQGLLGLVGPAVTLEILLEGRVFDATEAHAKGLLTRVVADDAFSAEIDGLVQRLARAAPMAARINKETVRRLTRGPHPLTNDEIDHLFRYAETMDHREGVTAFLEGRNPLFSGE